MLASSMALTGCGDKTDEAPELTAVTVDVQVAGLGDLTLKNSFVGNISPQETAYVIPLASGTVTEVNYRVGDHVNAGDVLFRIDDSGARLQLEQAQLNAANARQQVNMATGSQQSSTDLQLEGSVVSATSGYEQAQIAYFQVKRNFDNLADSVSKYEEMVNQFEKAIQSGDPVAVMQMQQLVAASLPESSVSSGNAGSPLLVLNQAKAQLATLQGNRDNMYDSLLQAEAAYRAAESGLNIANESKSLAQGDIRRDANAQARTGLELAQLGVDSAELALSYYTVTAPISGVVQSRSVEVNGLAGSGSGPAFTIANEDSMTVTFHVSESVKNTLRTGDVITVERGGAEYEGHITEVGVAVNQATGLFQVKANVSADDAALPSGVSVKITAETYAEQNVIVIPYDAVYYDSDSAYVYLSVDGRAVKTRVATGIFDDENIVITEGISQGDAVITSWSPRLLDGVEITPAGSLTE